MKKVICLLLIVIATMGFNNEKKYTLQLNEAELQAVWYCIEESNASNLTVKQVKDLISKQIAPQVDTTKKK